MLTVQTVRFTVVARQPETYSHLLFLNIGNDPFLLGPLLFRGNVGDYELGVVHLFF